MPTKNLIMFYNILVNSKIVYCIEVWEMVMRHIWKEIHVLQKKISRIIFKKNSVQLLYSFIEKLYRMKMALIAYRYFSNYFKNLEDQMSKRSHLDLPVPNYFTARRQRCFKYQVPTIWSSLSGFLRTLVHAGAFRVGLKQHLLASLKKWGQRNCVLYCLYFSHIISFIPKWTN